VKIIFAALLFISWPLLGSNRNILCNYIRKIVLRIWTPMFVFHHFVLLLTVSKFWERWDVFNWGRFLVTWGDDCMSWNKSQNNIMFQNIIKLMAYTLYSLLHKTTKAQDVNYHRLKLILWIIKKFNLFDLTSWFMQENDFSLSLWASHNITP
jgi:hypothetical protein